ncbi:hypothetical protein LEP1GSC125_0121 [Leptospira mayottensis 200901122]|uniref:Uncharacterized protein n=1 Tax=Leptospira mayottensis 200901122 TaxID=1193010 RepID=A0AA87SVV8_9LEPT|nr:hypothetical protein LEP1GSC125_0121 [Leptospira mayottensis 200901122]
MGQVLRLNVSKYLRFFKLSPRKFNEKRNIIKYERKELQSLQ